MKIRFGVLISLMIGVAAGDVAYGAEPVIGVSFDFISPFRTAEKTAIEKAISAAGGKMRFYDANKDAQRQASQVDTMIADHVDALIVIPFDLQAAGGLAQSAISAGIPFVSADSAPADLKSVTYHVGGDPCADGRAAGEYFVKVAKDKPFKLLELQGGLSYDNGLRRSKCLGEALKDHPNVTIVAQVPTDWNPEKALAGTENTLQAHPDLNGIYSPWNNGLQGVFSALKEKGKLVPVGNKDHIVLVSIDGTPLGCQAVRDGLLDLDIATPVADLGTKAVQAAIKAAGKGSIEPQSEFLPGLPYGPDNVKEKSSQVWGCN
ncbi:sugar ABC transporter substrate-binding protein [Mesorhizobium sp. CO1-1-8]|uniref:sugar ABC transporter substrate-binding protein n=1 Tax=Mesorhizobium sp. CO1-1-8 TaxID=2876631 RepID=UPI001CD17E57|nr:sugar ABC transporter substrate-binding protein [Mesorhizobium sp. CO1-1-8]MBZ9772408.1 sugar ABC transporter substrate-binding protein [Mesorhizobium sp. CO1-1-8]